MRILIIDPEYLVAMEAERILGEVFNGEIRIEMPRDYVSALENGRFDMVLVDIGLMASPEARQLLQSSGAAIVFSTLGDKEDEALAEWPGIAIVQKPFDEQGLIAAIKNAAGS